MHQLFEDYTQKYQLNVLSEKKVNKPMAGHFKKADVKPMKYLREVRVDAIEAPLKLREPIYFS